MQFSRFQQLLKYIHKCFSVIHQIKKNEVGNTTAGKDEDLAQMFQAQERPIKVAWC